MWLPFERIHLLRFQIMNNHCLGGLYHNIHFNRSSHTYTHNLDAGGTRTHTRIIISTVFLGVCPDWYTVISVVTIPVAIYSLSRVLKRYLYVDPHSSHPNNHHVHVVITHYTLTCIGITQGNTEILTYPWLQVCKDIVGSTLVGTQTIRAVHDFKTFLHKLCIKIVDKNIQK